ncbi:transposable element Tc1 transposase [Trichonephila clavipes]|nr:transposable element Tc1 transposase [Trichonephila clavipes]
MSNHQRLDDGMSIVCNLWKQLHDTESIEIKPGKGRPAAAMVKEDRNLSIIVMRNRGATASQLSSYLYFATGTRVSRVTVSKRLHERVLFARRSAVCIPLTYTNRRVHVGREPGTRYLPSNVREIDNYGGEGLIVWAGTMLDGRTLLHVFERGSVIGVRNRDEVLEPYVSLFRRACGPSSF